MRHVSHELRVTHQPFNDVVCTFRCIKENVVLIKKAFTDDFVIPEFKKFTDQIQDIYDLCEQNDGGQVRFSYKHFHECHQKYFQWGGGQNPMCTKMVNYFLWCKREILHFLRRYG